MTTTIRLPKLGLTMDEATVVRWLVAEGAPVAAGQTLLEVETDKATLEVESQAGGYLRRQLAAAGAKVVLGSPLGIVSTTLDEPVAEVEAGAEHDGHDRTAAAPREDSVAPDGKPGNERATAHGGGPASPAVRRRASELGIDLTTVRGSGPGGRIRESDLEALAEPVDRKTTATPGPANWTVSGMSRSRVATARRMVESATGIPQFSVRREVAMAAVVEARAHLLADAGAGAKVSLTDFLLAAVAQAMMAHPALRTRLIGDLAEARVAACPTANIGLAVDTPGGLLVPVLSDLGGKSVLDIARLRSQAVEVARTGRIGAGFAKDGTFTVSNLGPFDVDDFTALVSPGEAGVVAVGALRQRPRAEGQEVRIEPSLTLTFSFDHRLIDGAEGARFAARVVTELGAVAKGALPAGS